MQPIDQSDQLHPYRLAVLAAVTEGDAGTAFHLVQDLMDGGMGFDEVMFDILTPVQAELGTRWAFGDYTISEEHAATAAVETLVASLAGFFDLPDAGRPVTVACAEGDDHSLPGRMISALLLFEGWRATFLGPTIPADDLETYLRDVQPDAVVLTCGLVTNLAGARASVRAAHNAAVPVLAGGRGFGADDRLARAVGADAWSTDPQQIGPILQSWKPDIAASEAAAATPSPDFEQISSRRLQILAGAADRISAAAGPEVVALLSRRRWDDLSHAFDALTAALTVRDPGVLGGFAGWQRDWMSPRIADTGVTVSILGALRSAVGEAPDAASYLTEAVAALEASAQA